MKSPLPPLRAVEIFVVAGRALSFSAAAKTVNLTPSAVSRRMRDLERDPGTTLFRRFNRRLELTAAGARFLDAASRAIELIARESDAIRPRHRGTMLRLSVLQSLASTWLSPRLASLRAARPDLHVRKCRESLQKLGSDPTNGKGVACFDAVLAEAGAPLDSALQAADKFDAARSWPRKQRESDECRFRSLLQNTNRKIFWMALIPHTFSPNTEI